MESGPLVIEIIDGWVVVGRPGGRSIKIQRWNEETYYRALIAYGARESVAKAAAAGLITVDMQKASS